MSRHFLFVFISFIWVLACTPKAYISYQRTGEVESVSGDKSTITLVATGFAADNNTAAGYAERNAIENLLFKGIPGSVLENPIVADETAARSKHGDVLNKLIEQGGYMAYVIDAYTQDSNAQKSGVLIRRVIKLDYHALRKYLENENVIRRFGL